MQGLSGFGFGLVAMSVLPFFMELTSAVPLIAVYSLTLTLMMGWRHRAGLDRASALPMVVGGVLGIPIGIFFLKSGNPVWVKGTLGTVLMVFALWSLRSNARVGAPIANGWGLPAGFLGGILGGAFNTSGPPVVIYCSLRAWPKQQTVASLQAFFNVAGIAAVTGHSLSGLLTPALLWDNMVSIPALLGGLMIGNHLHDRVDQDAFRRVLLGAIFLFGVAYVAPILFALTETSR